MSEIKRRIKVIDFFLLNTGHALYQATTLESVCLQFRKILELIAFSSLIANKDRYSAVYKNFASNWNAEWLLKDLRRINPKFYPIPIEEKPSQRIGIKTDIIPITEGYLTEVDFISTYKKCGSILHAANPYGSKTSYHFFQKAFPLWRKKIILLLNCHEVHFVDNSGIWVIHMQEDGDDEVHFYKFELMDKNN
ncbi:MAG: hypothetical protein DU480_12460 [Nitrosomonas sp.]|uniref:hypothetical protein n=1 Tax=Nitrosomonas sp. TaxID=42353 RepID=UPI0032ECBD87